MANKLFTRHARSIKEKENEEKSVKRATAGEYIPNAPPKVNQTAKQKKAAEENKAKLAKNRLARKKSERVAVSKEAAKRKEDQRNVPSKGIKHDRIPKAPSISKKQKESLDREVARIRDTVASNKRRAARRKVLAADLKTSISREEDIDRETIIHADPRPSKVKPKKSGKPATSLWPYNITPEAKVNKSTRLTVSDKEGNEFPSTRPAERKAKQQGFPEESETDQMKAVIIKLAKDVVALQNPSATKVGAEKSSGKPPGVPKERPSQKAAQDTGRKVLDILKDNSDLSPGPGSQKKAVGDKAGKRPYDKYKDWNKADPWGHMTTGDDETLGR